MTREATIIGQIKDIDNVTYDIREKRPTTHGWDLCLGWPTGIQRGKGGGGGPRVILTTDLVEYLKMEKSSTKRIDLPIGKTSIARLRRLLGMNWQSDRAQWWEDRVDDLASLTLTQFSKRHQVSTGATCTARQSIFGSTQRPEGWWLEYEILTLLAGDSPRIHIADQLDVSLGSVGRLRHLVRKAMRDKYVGKLPLYDVVSFLASGKSERKIAMLCECSPPTIRNAIHRLRNALCGVKSKKSTPQNVGTVSFDTVIKKVREGETVTDIAKQAGVSVMAVYHAIHRAGLNIKNLRGRE